MRKDSVRRLEHQGIKRIPEDWTQSRVKWRLEPERFLDLAVLLPPVNEQRAIVAHIDAELTKLEALRVATDRTIALLKERRAALIAAAVTGQLEMT